MSDSFRIVPPMIRAEGKDVPPESIQAALNALAQQTTVAFNQIANGAGPIFSALMLAWFQSLPTTLPASPGVLWNNGGTLALS
ncbi:hypothetical protein [Burkholderia cenocepacia]|jgi:hypothetical protein|uniref:Uncharacterized protein n=1 Tax=Burkholderia cenocepacia TaxID=95486 RepID=A0AAW4TM58_9BURK|nr:hypothetical protein [Burkholderia cenocepacia]MCA8382523.1 hypothetical protein [Burkholderia cenocepacia]MDR5660998.1 hypothetical protein [Burkholderia cenocepacia]MDR8094156.1 hypothetical protein [Burkholderia cenocepacia]